MRRPEPPVSVRKSAERAQSWPSIPTSRRKIWPISSPITISASCCPTRASPRGWRTPISWSTPPSGYCFLTLYEKRVAPEDLPFFLGLMEHLAARGLICPQPVKNRTGDMIGWIAGRPAAIVTVPRRHVGAPPERGALRGGRGGAGEAASCRRGFPDAAGATRSRSTAGARSTWRPPRAPTRVQPGLREAIERELTLLEGAWPSGLPEGVIHADLFPDNVFFLGDRLSGLIDFYFACTDTLAYDVAICLNAWCFEPDHSYNVTKGRALLQGYVGDAAARGRGARRAAAARARRRAALPADAPGRLAQRAARRAGAAEGPARIFPQAALPPGGDGDARLRDRRMSAKAAHNVVIYTDGGCAPTNPGTGRLGRDPDQGRAPEGAEGRRSRTPPTTAWS